MIVAVVGTRTRPSFGSGIQYNRETDKRCQELVLQVFHSIDKSRHTILSGGADSGADYWAKTYASQFRMRYLECPAFWRVNGAVDRSAGLRRNTWIAELCTHLVAVWDGKSPGTADVIKKAQQFGKKVWVLSL